MKKCKKCENVIPPTAYIDGILVRLNKRSYCLGCAPYKSAKGYELRKRGNLKYSDTDIIAAVAKSTSLAQTINRLGMRAAGSNYANIKAHISRLALDTAHFTGQGHLKGVSHNWGIKLQLAEILVENSTYQSTNALKYRLVKEGFFVWKCYRCEGTEWQGVTIPLQLEHINGTHNDNRIENLTLLCPNCHALTPTYCGKNIKLRRPENAQFTGKQVESKRCENCDRPISKVSKECKSCSGKHKGNHKIEWPDCVTLHQMVNSTSYSAVGRVLGVSDNAIRKHISRHETVVLNYAI